MATYAVGDVQGCDDALVALLGAIAFRPGIDRLLFAGDLVNRGPASLAVLRRVRALGNDATVVLGNHDLHLLAVAAGARRRDTLEDVLRAPDRDDLLDWLRARPLLHACAAGTGDAVVVHAGLLPAWSVDRAAALAREVERELRDRPAQLLASMYGDEPARWDDGLRGPDRHRVVLNALTRMRLVTPDGALHLGYSGPPAGAPAGLVPWFDAPGRASDGARVVCGHWAALGLVVRPDLVALDSGCVWGRDLTALRLEDDQVFSVRCRGG